MGPFNVYDREETLGAHLDQYDSNNLAQLSELLDHFFFPVFTDIQGYTVEHRSALAASFQRALSDPNFDFASLLKSAFEDTEFSLPPSWVFNNSRQFFVLTYTVLLQRWGEDFKRHAIHYSSPNDY